MLADPNPIHRDAQVVAALGLGDRPINPGPANLAYLYEMLRACFPGAETRSLRARLTGNVYVGDEVEVTGTIVAAERVDAGTLVRCALTLRGAEHAPPAAVATAEVLVPLSPAIEASCRARLAGEAQPVPSGAGRDRPG
jgi:acyl dehydratase